MKKQQKFKIIEFARRSDYGEEFYLSILKGNRHVFLQIAFDICEYPGWPYLQISSGMGKVFSCLFSVWKFGFSFDILGHPWRLVRPDEEN